jgi:hypothetical protein
MALKEVIVKFDHMKKLVKMHINLDESLSKLKNTLNNFLDLDNEDVRVSYLAYYYPYMTLKDDIHSWQVVTNDDEVRTMFLHAEFDECPMRLFVRTNCGCH